MLNKRKQREKLTFSTQVSLYSWFSTNGSNFNWFTARTDYESGIVEYVATIPISVCGGTTSSRVTTQ